MITDDAIPHSRRFPAISGCVPLYIHTPLAAKLLGVTEGALRKMVKIGEIRRSGTKHGRFHRDDLAALRGRAITADEIATADQQHAGRLKAYERYNSNRKKGETNGSAR
jgi:hypothetical protein